MAPLPPEDNALYEILSKEDRMHAEDVQPPRMDKQEDLCVESWTAVCRRRSASDNSEGIASSAASVGETSHLSDVETFVASETDTIMPSEMPAPSPYQLPSVSSIRRRSSDPVRTLRSTSNIKTETYKIPETPKSSPYQISKIVSKHRRSFDPVPVGPSTPDLEETHANNKEADIREPFEEFDSFKPTPAMPKLTPDAAHGTFSIREESIGGLDNFKINPKMPTAKLDAVPQSALFQKEGSRIGNGFQATVLDLKDMVPWIVKKGWKQLYSLQVSNLLPKMLQRNQSSKKADKKKRDSNTLLNMDLETIVRVWDGEDGDDEGGKV